MQTRTGLLAAIACFAIFLHHPSDLIAVGDNAVALTGKVTSADEGAMEGVLVSARRAGATVTTTVVSDRDGRYEFPRARLEPGDYTLRIRAIGYDLEPVIGRGRQGQAGDRRPEALEDQRPRRAADQRRVAREHARHRRGKGVDARLRALPHAGAGHHDRGTMRPQFVGVIERMAGYPPLSFPLMVQKTPSPRIGGGPVSAERQQEARRRQAEYLSQRQPQRRPEVELSVRRRCRGRPARRRASSTPSTTCRNARASRTTSSSTRRGWRGMRASASRSSASSIRRPAKVTEYQIPLLKPNAPTGILGMRFDHDQNLWMGMQFQGGIAKFDKKTEKFQTWSLPPELNGDHVQINQVSPDRHHIDGKVWLQDAGTYTVLRLDVASRHVREVRAVQDSAAQRLRRHPRFEEQRLLPGDGRGGGREDRREDRADRDLQDADARVGAAARDDGRAGSAVVRREPLRQDRDVRYADPDVQGVGAADAGRVAVRRHHRQERRRVVGRRVQRSHPAPESEDGRIRRVSAAAADQRPPRLRRQLDDARSRSGSAATTARRS